jgi:hypothetical protein
MTTGKRSVNFAAANSVTDGYLADIQQTLLDSFEQYSDFLSGAGSRREADRMLIDNNLLTEAELVEIYKKCFHLDDVIEDELQIPDSIPGISMEYLNAVSALPLLTQEIDNNNEEAPPLPWLVQDLYETNELDYQSRRLFGRPACFIPMRRTFIERQLAAVARSADNTEQIITAECDPEKLKTLRESFPVFRDRRPDLYRL